MSEILQRSATPAAPRPGPAAAGETSAASGARPGCDPRGPRRAYSPPHLDCHGNLAEVTRFGGSQIIDSGGGLGNQF